MNADKIKELKPEAKKIAAGLKVAKLYANVNGEYFTSENLALLSVGGKKDDITEFEFDAEKEAAKVVTISKEDMANHPELKANGYKAGDKLEPGQDIAFAIANKKA